MPTLAKQAIGGLLALIGLVLGTVAVGQTGASPLLPRAIARRSSALSRFSS